MNKEPPLMHPQHWDLFSSTKYSHGSREHNITQYMFSKDLHWFLAKVFHVSFGFEPNNCSIFWCLNSYADEIPYFDIIVSVFSTYQNRSVKLHHHQRYPKTLINSGIQQPSSPSLICITRGQRLPFVGQMWSHLVVINKLLVNEHTSVQTCSRIHRCRLL